MSSGVCDLDRAERLYAAIAAEVGKGGSAVQVQLIVRAFEELRKDIKREQESENDPYYGD